MRRFLRLVRSPVSYAQTTRRCLISPEGWVTRAIAAITRRKHWTTYFKLLERGSLRTLRIAHALFEAILQALPLETLNLVMDDTLVPRQSVKAPGSLIRHDHARKTNRSQFLQAQCWVTLGVSVLGGTGRKYGLCYAPFPPPAIATN